MHSSYSSQAKLLHNVSRSTLGSENSDCSNSERGHDRRHSASGDSLCSRTTSVVSFRTGSTQPYATNNPRGRPPVIPRNRSASVAEPHDQSTTFCDNGIIEIPPHQTSEPSGPAPPPRPRPSVALPLSPKSSYVHSTLWLLRRRTLIKITVAALFLSIISTGLLLFLLLKHDRPSWESMSFQEGAYKTCVQCSHLRQDAERRKEETDNIKKLDNEMREGGVLYCCASTGEQMSALVHLILRRQTYLQVQAETDAKTADNTFNWSPVSAHVKLRGCGVPPYQPNFKSMTPLYLWCPNQQSLADSDILHANNVKRRNISLEIIHPGLYFVYASVKFTTSVKCGELDSQIWSHHINMYDAQGDVTLVKSTHTCCNGCADEMATKFAGGVFQFQKHNQVYVKVSGHGLVDFDDRSSYLGLVMLGSANENT